MKPINFTDKQFFEENSARDRRHAKKQQEQQEIAEYALLIEKDVAEMPDSVLPLHQQYCTKEEKDYFKTVIAITNREKRA